MKIKLEAQKNALYPMPTVLVGTHMGGKPNYAPIAHVGIMDFGTISVSVNQIHHTNAGIKENGAFSVNIPSVDLVKEVDYCGLVSGKRIAKGQLFQVFYGTLDTAPLISACPINMACRLTQTVTFPKHDVFIGEIVETYCEQACMTEDELDWDKVQPILFTMAGRRYWNLGTPLAKAWRVGKALKD
jgi:flavin reductase (DIM6/NTAB) family NADH-FMN oxidoreductase RutF